ncbi:Gfo/Idh/MocA family oxidoreductase [Paludicola sp. MB14-C6]|uniref:Gfo/Idh/MocA family protein n=1 Tax=Paludihabitans sp. MB14-C6 TaxID=3070656 RepID=UPI0027DE56F8|nr:Gfo/Idh/MocA family oxidoreductase [Paludicola sp. MB14-C6]WMJ23266.1 Gfo/Idh/MocA family oxidoreductase [Paludicola sp. MB14-C6]
MKKLRLAILGQGRSGRNIHGAYLKTNLEQFEVAYVVDPIALRRERAKEEYGCVVLETYQELFDKTDIDFVVNATPSYLHPSISIDLLNHGFNVLSEKPFARTVQEVDDIIAAAQNNNCMIAVFQQSRFAPYYNQVKSVIDFGVLGRLVQVSIEFNGYARRWDWQCCQDFYGGSLLNTGPHPVDQALDILNFREGMPNVMCKMDRVNTFGDAEDYVKLILTAPDRPLIDVEICSCDAYPSFTYNIMGTTGGLKGGMNEMKWRYFKPEESPEQHIIRTPICDEEGFPKYCSEQLKWYEEEWKTENTGTFTDAVDSLYQTVYNHLVNNVPLVVTPQQVRQQIAVIEECHKQNPLSKKF